MIKIIYLLVAVAIILGLAGLWLGPKAVQAPTTTVPDSTTTLCTMDAMQCPDGSYVGRTGPKCEFVCPIVATTTPVVTDYSNEIAVTTPLQNAVIASGAVVTGKARGWYFEGSFPIELRDSTGVVIAQGPAMAQSDWMTSEFVPFKFTLTFSNPYHVGDPEAKKLGTLTLHNDNPSGLPENEKSITIPIRFAP